LIIIFELNKLYTDINNYPIIIFKLKKMKLFFTKHFKNYIAN